MPNPSRRPQGTSRNTYEFTPEERVSYYDERLQREYDRRQAAYPAHQPRVWTSGGGGSGNAGDSSVTGSAGGWPMPRYLSGGAGGNQLDDQLHAFLQQVHSSAPPLPRPTDEPRRVIDAAVRNAVVDLQRTCHLQTRHQMMPDLYASPDMITEMHRHMQQTVLREMSDQLKEKIRFTVHPQGYGKLVEADVVIMSPVELQMFAANLTRQVIEACVKQGYFR